MSPIVSRKRDIKENLGMITERAHKEKDLASEIKARGEVKSGRRRRVENFKEHKTQI